MTSFKCMYIALASVSSVLFRIEYHYHGMGPCTGYKSVLNRYNIAMKYEISEKNRFLSSYDTNLNWICVFLNTKYDIYTSRYLIYFMYKFTAAQKLISKQLLYVSHIKTKNSKSTVFLNLYS